MPPRARLGSKNQAGPAPIGIDRRDRLHFATCPFARRSCDAEACKGAPFRRLGRFDRMHPQKAASFYIAGWPDGLAIPRRKGRQKRPFTPVTDESRTSSRYNATYGQRASAGEAAKFAACTVLMPSSTVLFHLCEASCEEQLVRRAFLPGKGARINEYPQAMEIGAGLVCRRVGNRDDSCARPCG